MADNMRRLNPENIPSATGIAWYKPSTYAACLEIYADKATHPATFDEWIVIAKNAEQQCRDQGMRVMRIEIEPRTLKSWCDANGFQHIDTQALGHYVNGMVHDNLVAESENSG